jgi:Arc/MetJ-type ribon-helix-helix transcriptional regulator
VRDDELRQTSVLLPSDLYDWLRREAFDRGVSQSQVIREALEAVRQSTGGRGGT